MTITRKPIKVNEQGVGILTLLYEQGMKPDFSDVHFTDNNLEEINFKRMNVVPGVQASFMVNLFTPKVYAYFGNPSDNYNPVWNPDLPGQMVTHEFGWKRDSASPLIPRGAPGQQDDYFVYSPAAIKENNTTYIFYGGNRLEGSNPKLENHIFLAIQEGDAAPVKQGIVVNKTTVPGLGVSPFDIQKIGDLYYLFVTSFYASGAVYRMGYITSPTLSPFVPGPYVPLEGVNANAHSPRYLEDPADPTQFFIYYTEMPNFGIRRATAKKSNPKVFTDNIKVLSGLYVYPQVHYNPDTELFEMIVAQQNANGTSYSTVKTASLDGRSFPASSLKIIANGGSGAFDENYLTTPFRLGNKLYWSGRKVGVDGYQGIGSGTLVEEGGLLDWDFGEGVVQAQSTYKRSGAFAGQMIGNASISPMLGKLSRGPNRTYSVYIYDDMAATQNLQTTFRLMDTANDVSVLMGIYTVTSATKYIYRKKGGTWAISTVNRSLGWHKLSFEITDKIIMKIDDQVIAEDLTFNVATLKALCMYGYKAGNSYIDDFGYTELVTDLQVGSEAIDE